MSEVLDDTFRSLLAVVEQGFSLQAVDIDPALARPKSYLKILDVTHYNWTAERFRKIFGMRFRVRLPPLDQFNTIFYPELRFDTPIFLCFALLTRRRLIAHLNVYCPFADEDYLARHVTPLVRRLERYPPFDSEDRYPEWMKPYRQPCSIYGMYPRDRIEDFAACARDYAEHYVMRAREARPVTDTVRRDQIAAFHRGFIDDIRTQDKAQGMIAKMIGRDTARRIFYEVTT